MNSNLKGKTIVKGVFRELAVHGLPVLLRSEGKECICRVSLNNDNRRNASDLETISFEQNELQKSGLLEIQFELDGKLYKASLTPEADDYSNFLIPEELSLSQRRGSRRVTSTNVSLLPLVAEVRYLGVRVYGKLKESNGRYITISFTNLNSTPQPGTAVSVRVYDKTRQVVKSEGKVSYLRVLDQNGCEIVIDSKGDFPSKNLPRSPRWNLIKSAELEVFWPDEEGLKLKLNVVQAAITGFAASLCSSDQEIPPLGAICKLSPLDILARVVWMSDTAIGFDLRINDASGIARWTQQVEDWIHPGLHKIAPMRQRAQILKIMLRSGYLRGKKAQIFSEEALEFLIPNRSVTRSWLSRYSRTHENLDSDIHISYLRISDSSWMIQELGHLSQNASGADTITHSMLEFFSREQSFSTLDSHMIALYDQSSRFNNDFWLPKVETNIGSYSECTIHDLSFLQKVAVQNCEEGQNYQFDQTDLDRWDKEFSELSKYFDFRLLRGLGLGSSTFDSPNLKQQLIQSGYILHRQIMAIKKDGKVVGAAVSFGLPTFANLSATANHLWLILNDLIHLPEVLNDMAKSRKSHKVLSGTTEVIVIPGRENVTKCPVLNGTEARPFSLLSVPILKIPEFLGVGT